MREDAKPTMRQVVALAAALCQLVDEPFPATRQAASELIERFRRELGHPHPRLEDTPQRSRPARAGPSAVATRELDG